MADPVVSNIEGTSANRFAVGEMLELDASLLVSPAEVGMVIVATEAGKFQARRPLLSRSGWLCNRSGVLLVPGRSG